MKTIIIIDNTAKDTRVVIQDHDSEFLSYELGKVLGEMRPRLKAVLLTYMSHELTGTDAAKAFNVSKERFRQLLGDAKKEFRDIARKHGVCGVSDFSIRENEHD